MSDASLLAFPIRQPGRLLLGATTTSGSWPFGGQPIGVRRAAKLAFVKREQEIRDPANGALLRVVNRSVERARIVFMLEPPWDLNVLPKAFSKGTSFTGDYRIEGATIPLAAVAPLSLPLSFVTDDEQQDSIHFRLTVSRLTFQEATELSLQGMAGLPLVFDPVQAIDTSDPGFPFTPSKPPWQICRWANVTL